MKGLKALDHSGRDQLLKNILSLALIFVIIWVVMLPCCVPRWSRGLGHLIGGVCKACCQSNHTANRRRHDEREMTTFTPVRQEEA